MDLVVRGARENNLDDLTLTFEPGKLYAFCGPSGSGKSSLAFDTLHREGQRRYLEALLQRAAHLRRPDVESIVGLPPTIGLDQRERAASHTQTVAGLCELELGLAVLYGRAGVQHCPVCGDAILPATHDAIVAQLLALPEGTRLTLEAPVQGDALVVEEVVRSGFSRVRVGGVIKRLEEVRSLPADARIVVDRIKVEPSRSSRLHDAVRLAARAGRGVIVAVHEVEQSFVDRPLCVRDGLELPALQPSRFRLLAGEPNLGLDSAGQAVRFAGRTLLELLALTVAEARAWLAQVPPSMVTEGVLADLIHRLGVLEQLGLQGLTLGTPANEVSRGEAVRLRLARQVSSQVSGVLYVVDEAASGLDAASAEAVVQVLRTLVAQGNTVIAVDHHPALIAAADEVVEFGPGGGPEGGRVVYRGPASALGDTATGRALRGELKTEPFKASGPTVRLGAWTVDGTGVTVLTGPSGAGKTLALESLTDAGNYERRIHAGVAAVTRSRRSSPATVTGLWNVLRDLLAQTREAKIQGFTASTFSLNTSGGRCEACGGEGEIRTVMDPLPDVWTRCGVCYGRRFQADVLEVHWKGHAPDELLDLPAEQAHPLLAGHPKLERGLRALLDVGLGHVQLGRSTDSMSGGEVRRLKLAAELAKGRGAGLILADDPSLGLHPLDTVKLMGAFARLAEEGNTVVLASSDPWVLQGASRVVTV